MRWGNAISPPSVERTTRDGIARATDRARRLKEIGDELVDRFGIGTEESPDAEELRALAASATTLGVSDRSASMARTEAQSLRELAEERDRIEGVLARLAGCFEFETATQVTSETMELAVDLLRGADADLLSSRTGSLTRHEARRILDRSENDCRELKQTRDDLSARFDLASMPCTGELQQAARALNAARGPLLFDGAGEKGPAATPGNCPWFGPSRRRKRRRRIFAALSSIARGRCGWKRTRRSSAAWAPPGEAWTPISRVPVALPNGRPKSSKRWREKETAGRRRVRSCCMEISSDWTKYGVSPRHCLRTGRRRRQSQSLPTRERGLLGWKSWRMI